MKILMLGWELPPHFVGGLGIASYQICQYLAQSGADIEFILPFEADFDEIDFMKVNPVKKVSFSEVVLSGAAAYGSTILSSTVHSGNDLFKTVHTNYIAKAAHIARYGEYDVIHAHDWMTFRAALVAKQISGLPLIVHVHATEFDRSGGNSGNELIHEIEYLGMSMADQVIAVSQITKNTIIARYGINPDKIKVVHNSIDVASKHLQTSNAAANDFVFFERMKEQGFRVISNIGRMTMQKGLMHFLEAAAISLAHHDKLYFMFVGSGDQREELIERAADLGIASNVLFVDFQNGKRLRDAYAITDLFVMPSVAEPFGLTALEAIALGTPVMLSHQSGVGEVLQNVLKVDFWDTQAMANNIVSVAQNDVLRDELHANSYREFLRQTWADAAIKIHDVYGKAVAAV